MKSLSRVRAFATPWTVAHQAPPSMEFSRQEYWSGLPFPSPGDLPNSVHIQMHTHTHTQKWNTNLMKPCPYNIRCTVMFSFLLISVDQSTPRWLHHSLMNLTSYRKYFVFSKFLSKSGYTWVANHTFQFSSFQLLSHVWLFATPWTAACQASLSITDSQSLLKLMFIESSMLSNHLILCRPLLLPPSTSIRVFSNELVLCIRWPKYWSFSFTISPCNEYSGLISFRMDWFDLLVVQGTLKSLLQHHSSKASIHQCSQLSL